MTRKAAFAGVFYEANPQVLEKQITDCFTSDFGPGDLPTTKRKKSVKAIIVPHAGYAYSGPCAAWSYKEIGETKIPDLYILIGPNHRDNGSGISMENWETPFGVVRVDQEFAKALISKGSIGVDENIHGTEHSVEVQLPFLQFVNKESIGEIKILPIILSSQIDYTKLSLDLKETIIDLKRNVIFIISSDFTHFGRNYGYVPFSLDIKKRIYELDGEAIGFIEKMDAQGFLNVITDKMMTICGFVPIAFLLKTIKSSKVDLTQYYTSSDITHGDYKNSVSYASIVFY